MGGRSSQRRANKCDLVRLRPSQFFFFFQMFSPSIFIFVNTSNKQTKYFVNFLSVRLGNTFKFILLLDSVRVGASLGGIDQLIGQTLSNGLDVSEAGFAGSGAQKPDSLVDTPKWGNVYSLTTDSTGRPILVESSLGPELMIALTNTWRGFSPDKRWMISKLCLTIRTVISFLPLLRPCIMSEFTNLSTIGHKAFLNRFAAYRPAEWGKYFADFSFTGM